MLSGVLTRSGKRGEKNLAPEKTEPAKTSRPLSTDEKFDVLLDKISIIENCVSCIKEAVTSLQSDVGELLLSVDVLNQKPKQHTLNITKTKWNVDSLEQYTRRNNLRLFGIPENTEENTDTVVVSVLNSRLKMTLRLVDIERTHRVGKVQKGETKRPRAIIIKFCSYRIRHKVFQAKKLLKGTGIVLKEDLTTLRATLLSKAVQRWGTANIWTHDGKFFRKDNDGKRIVVDLKDLADHDDNSGSSNEDR